jgi:hypothetical protein
MNNDKPKNVIENENLNVYSPNNSRCLEDNDCVKGSIFPQKDRGRWAVNWYCTLKKRSFVITKRKNHFMPITRYKLSHDNKVIIDEKCFPIPDKERCHGYKIAVKLLGDIQTRWELRIPIHSGH